MVHAWQRLSALLVVAAAGALLAFVDLSPEMGRAFFFAGDDPRFAEDQRIEQIFPEPPQVFLSVASSDIGSSEYIQRIGHLSQELHEIEGVVGIYDLLHGPDEVADGLENPLWQRLLIAEGGDASDVVVSVRDEQFELVWRSALMIHLVVRARRNGEDSTFSWPVWVEARQDLWHAAVGSTLIISMGFALLLFSNLLPTRRLGLSVVVGTVMALALALLTFPRLATWLTPSEG